MRRLFPIILLLIAAARAEAAPVSPAAVGFGNLLVPGLGATLRGDSGRGLLEAGIEIGLFYGGTFGVREGTFTIDTTIVLPQRGSLYRPLLGQTLQQFGIKLHMYDTFYHYQQACLAMADSEREKSNPQPLYKGDWSDTLLAPFKWKNLSNPWVFSVIAAATIYVAVDYNNSAPKRSSYVATGGEDALYLAHNILVEPLGSAFGEEPVFRGFIQRETRLYTGSLIASLLIQSAIFTALHPADAKLAAFLGGIYFGFLVERFHGDLEPAIAAHFWVNVVNGFFQYLSFRKGEGKSTPFSAPMGLTVAIPF